ncbi:hypothetical protein Bca52824_035641 [Brassica carinata]|uniref:Replication protein A 70 kDa DNA-binding subunit B/D first OB fold domain-containing protein n=1 Tax=Brassica carinata TaxID=52824 RepID=A0A8X7S7X6_BRACI|nr:hypothetical protein Bca52824_035641 [Brassica carinata]
MTSKMQIKTFSSANEAKIPINDLKPKHTTKMVHVKVLHSWKQNVQPGGETLEFVLADEKNTMLLMGNLTDILHSACNQDDGMVTLLFRFAKPGKFRGELQISNSFDASQMIINPTIPEAEAFKDM